MNDKEKREWEDLLKVLKQKLPSDAYRRLTEQLVIDLPEIVEIILKVNEDE